MLPFENAILEKIEPWARSVGLNIAMSTPRAARFESETVFLQLLFDNLKTYALIVEVGQKAATERPFGLHEILKMNGSGDAKYLTVLSPMGAETLLAALDNVKKWLEQYGLPYLQNSTADFQKLSAFRKSENLEMAEPKKMREIRLEAKADLNRGNLLSYIRAMRSIEIVLTATERIELARAEKQVLWG